MSKIRVLNITYTLGAGGIEAFNVNVFKNINRDQFEIDFVVIKPEGDKQFHDGEINKLGGNIIAIGDFSKGKIRKYLSYEKKIYNLIKSGNYDAVHINSGHIHTIPEVIMSKLLKVNNIIVHSHNGKLMQSVRFYRIRCCLQCIYRFVVPKIATYMLTCSDMASKWAFSKKSIESGRIIQVNNGIDLELFYRNFENRDNYRKKLNVTGKIVVGHIGRMNVQKNHAFLLDVFAEIKKIESNAVLLLCGDGELRNELEKKAKDLNIAEDVIFYGITDEIPEMLQAMDVFIFPSLFEGLPVVGIEAQASGIPILASDTITKSVALTPSWHVLKLSDSSKIWAEEAIKCVKQEGRCDNRKALRDAGFDIVETTRKMELIYSGRYFE